MTKWVGGWKDVYQAQETKIGKILAYSKELDLVEPTSNDGTMA